MKAAEQEISTKSAETRKRILEAALTCFRQRGFEAATMREIAAEAGMSVGAAYYYFDSKEAIVMAFYERSQREMEPMTAKALALSRDLEERLRALIAVNAVWPGVSRNVTHFSPTRTRYAPMCWVIPPASPAATFALRIRSSRLVFP